MMKDQESLLCSFLEGWETKEGIRVFTSGSTGAPKEILLTGRQIRRSARRTNNFFNIGKNSRVHSAVSFEYIGGKMMIARSLVSGCELTFSTPSLNPIPPAHGTPVNLMSVVPAQMPHIIENLNEFNHVENFLLGGSAIDDRLWDKIVQAGIKAWESYGMTETASHVALRRVVGPSSRRPFFVPLPGISIKLDFEDCIHICDEDIIVVTNDIARMDPHGNFEILGRRDDIINTGGIKVLPHEIESILAPYISDFAEAFYITSEKDEIWTSRIVLVLVPKEKYLLNEAGDVLSRVRNIIDTLPEELIPRKKRPKTIRLANSLPYTSSGKLDRKKLPNEASTIF